MTRYMWRRVSRAAQMRARCASWEAVAAAVKSRPEVCSRWPMRYPFEWQHAMQAEQRRMFEETNILVLQGLKEMLMHKNEKVRLKAARLMKKYGGNLAVSMHAQG